MTFVCPQSATHGGKRPCDVCGHKTPTAARKPKLKRAKWGVQAENSRVARGEVVGYSPPGAYEKPPKTNSEEPKVKSGKKAARRAAKKAYSTRGLLQKTASGGRRQRIAALAKAVGRSEGQTRQALGVLLVREQLAQARSNENAQAMAIAAASRQGVANAVGGPSLNRQMLSSRAQVDDVETGNYERLAPSQLPGGDPTLPSLVEIHKLESDLEKALRATDGGAARRAEQIGYALTRQRLIRAHKLGEV